MNHGKANIHLRNTVCPKCREDGHDMAGDNLALYSDGSSYCWCCHYWTNGSNPLSKLLDRRVEHVPKIPTVKLPIDSDVNLSSQASTWLDQYGITKSDRLKHNILYSEKGCRIREKQADNLLIFPYWNDGELLAWQGRYFGIDKSIPKWVSRGKLEAVCHVINPFKNKGVGHAGIKNDRLIIVEDVVSAIKVAKAGFYAMPIFGTNLKNRWRQIRVLSPIETILWLDGDMATKAIKEAHSARLQGLNVKALLSDLDPKCYNINDIQGFINAKS